MVFSMASLGGTNSEALQEGKCETTNFFWMKNLDDAKILEKNWIVGTTLDENKVKLIIDEYCHSLPCDFVKSHPSNLKQKQERNCIKSRILWQLKDIPFHGIPFSVVSHDVLKCTFSMDYHSKKRKKIAVCNEEKGSDSNGLDHAHSNNLCPAKINIKKLIRYPSFALPSTASRPKRLDTLKALKNLVETETENTIRTENVFWLRIPLPTYHNHEFLGKDRTIHRDILATIKNFVKNGNTNPDTIKDLIDNYVKEKFMYHENPPLLDDYAYYPSIQNINFVIYNAQFRKIGTYNESNGIDKTKNVETCSKALEKPNTLEDVVQAFCVDSLQELDCSDPQLVLNLRANIGREFSRVMEFVNNCEEPERLDYIVNTLSNLP